MELRHLRYFVAVAEELNFRRAAERLHVAHPSLSKQIQNLEHELGLSLLERNTAGVRLTNAGAVYLEAARQILHLAEEAVHRAKDAAAGRLGRLVIGDAGPLTAKLIPSLLLSFRKLHPSVEISLHETQLPDQLDDLEQGNLQVAFSMLSEAEVPAHLDHLLVLRSPVCLLLNRQHALVQRASLHLEELRAESVICLGTNTRLPGHAERVTGAYLAKGLPVPRIRRVSSLETLHAMLVSNQGVAFLPRALAPRNSPEIVVRSLRELGPNTWFELRAVWRRKESSPLVPQFVSLLRSAVT